MVEPTYKVAIGLPVYNGESFLEKTLECILSQSFREFELIISDNASTDATSEICKQYAERDLRIRYVRQEENLGAVPNFNKVFELSNSEYFKWAAVDDWFDHDYLQELVNVLDNNTDVVWCHSLSSHVDHLDRPLKDPASQNVSYRDRCAAAPSQRLKAILFDDQGCIDSYGLIRSSAIRSTSMYLPYYGPEKVFIAELALQGRYSEISKPLFFVRVLQEGSGAIDSASAQNEFAVGGGGGNPYFVRLNFLVAYAKAIYRTRIGIRESIWSYLVLARWLLQISKWPRVMMRALRGKGIGGGNVKRIKDAEQKELNIMDGKT